MALLAQMIKVDAQTTKLRASLSAIRPPEWGKVTFDVQADIKTVSRSGPRIKLRYSIAIDTFPLVYRAEIGGVAYATTEILAKDESLEDLGEGALNEVAMQIYRSNFEGLYLALSTLGLEAPSPWLVKDVRLV